MSFVTKAFKTLFGRPIVDVEGNGEGLIMLSKEHAMIHAGKAFSGRVEDVALGTGQSLIAHIVIPEGMEIHLKEFILYTSGSGLTFLMYENPTITKGSNKGTPINRNRESTNISSVEIYDDSTYSAGAGIKLDGFSASGDKKISIGFTETDLEWVLKPGNYIFEIVNDDNGDAIVWMNGFWYEEKE